MVARASEPVQPDAVLAGLASGDIPDTIVVAGEDVGARDRITHAVRAALGTDALQIVPGDEKSESFGSVSARLGVLSLLTSGRRLVHVRRAEEMVAHDRREAQVPHGRPDVVLLWETDVDARTSPVIKALLAGADDALVVDCSVPRDAAFDTRVRARAAEWGGRLSDGAVHALRALAAADGGALDRVVSAATMVAGDREVTAADVEAAGAGAATVTSGEFVRALGTRVRDGDAAGAMELWATAGSDRGDPAPVVGFVAGSMLAGLEKGYGPRRPIARTADLLRACGWVDDALKSGLRDRDVAYAYLVAHLSGVDRHRKPGRPPRR